MMVHTRLSKWGNSVALRIPKAALEQIGLDEHSEVSVSVKKGKLIIALRQSDELPRYTLEELLEGMTLENRHEEFSDHFEVGAEVWE